MKNSYKTISSEEFKSRYLAIHDSIFTGRLVHQKPFENPNWEIILLPGGIRFPKDIFLAWEKAALECGDSEVILTDCDQTVDTTHNDTILMTWDYQNIKDIYLSDSFVGVLDTNIFGQSGSWGIICYSKDDFSCIGGPPSFIDNFSSPLGGRKGLKENFYDFMLQGWFIDEKMKLEILKSVGWQ